MNKLALIGIVAVVMVAAAAVAAVATPSAFANRPGSRSDDDRNNINVCRNCQSAQNSGDDSLNTNGGIVQTR